MSKFELYFDLGLEHILDIKGYDHILFVVALASIYLLRDWKKVLILITAFTIGHSITLALATFQLVSYNASLIEFLIPVTIFITAFVNLFRKEGFEKRKRLHTNYVFALTFGLVHGLGFSSYLRSLLGRTESIFTELLAFNLGLELGQAVVVIVFLTGAWLFVDIFGITRRDWKMVISAAIAGIALTIMIETKFW